MLYKVEFTYETGVKSIWVFANSDMDAETIGRQDFQADLKQSVYGELLGVAVYPAEEEE